MKVRVFSAVQMMHVLKMMAGLLLCLLSLAAIAEPSLPLPGSPHIVVVGSGKLSATPDVVKISLTVEETAKTFAAASKVVNESVAGILKVAAKQGIADKDIQASQIYAAPQYRWENDKQVYKGEQVTRELKITLKDTGSYNSLVTDLLKQSLARLQNTQLSFSNQQALEAKALQLALDDAQQRAEVIVRKLNGQIQSLYQVAPLSQSPHFYPVAMQASRSADAVKEAGGLQIGEQEIEQRVRVVYLLQ